MKPSSSLPLKFISVVSVFFSISAHASEPLLSYSWGNQVENSSFVLFSDGTIEHKEWSNFGVAPSVGQFRTKHLRL